MWKKHPCRIDGCNHCSRQSVVRAVVPVNSANRGGQVPDISLSPQSFVLQIDSSMNRQAAPHQYRDFGNTPRFPARMQCTLVAQASHLAVAGAHRSPTGNGQSAKPQVSHESSTFVPYSLAELKQTWAQAPLTVENWILLCTLILSFLLIATFVLLEWTGEDVACDVTMKQPKSQYTYKLSGSIWIWCVHWYQRTFRLWDDWYLPAPQSHSCSQTIFSALCSFLLAESNLGYAFLMGMLNINMFVVMHRQVPEVLGCLLLQAYFVFCLVAGMYNGFVWFVDIDPSTATLAVVIGTLLGGYDFASFMKDRSAGWALATAYGVYLLCVADQSVASSWSLLLLLLRELYFRFEQDDVEIHRKYHRILWPLVSGYPHSFAAMILALFVVKHAL
jgi:hypothetical protein